jgi:23S rRNA pseudouridine1911/1915/1917 synthase
MKVIIKKEQAGQRLDKFILAQIRDFSRAYLQKQIHVGAVLVNEKIRKPSYLLKEHDEIVTNILPPQRISLAPDPTIKLNIVFEDNDVIVVDKPAGLTVHPSASQKSGTLVNGLLAYNPLLKEVGEDPTRPGIVHRLDKDTSGLIIIAKNNRAFEFLKNQFKNKEIGKKYLALVDGRPKEAAGKIETFISRAKSDPTKQKVSKTGRKAVTLYKILEAFKDYSLVEAVPKTGRRHQIRVHLAYLGNPVAGDKKYGHRSSLMPLNLNRHFLHAAELTVVLPNGQKRTFNSPLPPELVEIMDGLK